MRSTPATAQRGFRMLGLCVILGLAGCKLDKTAEHVADYHQREKVCADSMVGKSRIPIIGGGEIDLTRFSFFVPQMSAKDDGECGAVGFETEFYWTGDKIVTPAEVPLVDLPGHSLSKVKIRDLPPHWRLLRVAARLGTRKLAKQCRENFDPNKCPDPNEKPTGPAPTWPEHLTVRPKAYPGLEIRLDPVRDRRPSDIAFFIPGWPRWDGVTPRHITCLPNHVDFPLHTMTPVEMEKIDFGNRTIPCDVDFRSFDFKGGAARISTGTEALRGIVPALQALQRYLFDSIIKED